jgi:hypothetical protein
MLIRTEVGVKLYARGRARGRRVVRARAAVGRVGCNLRVKRRCPTRQTEILDVCGQCGDEREGVRGIWIGTYLGCCPD